MKPKKCAWCKVELDHSAIKGSQEEVEFCSDNCETLFVESTLNKMESNETLDPVEFSTPLGMVTLEEVLEQIERDSVIFG